MTTTAAVPLRGDWVPDNQANCLKTDDVWQWDYGIPEDRRTVVGAPSQTTECLPKGWSRKMTYEGTQCPPRYTEACQATEDGLAVVCCPTMHDFSCQPSSDLATGPHASVFRCMSQYTDRGSWVVTQTFMTAAEPSTRLVTPSYGPGIHLFALAIIYATPTATTESSSAGSTVSSTESSSAGSTVSSTGSASSAPTSSSTSDEPSGGNLSVGASAGIGVGAAAAVVLLAVAGWLLYRRRKKNSRRLRAEPPGAGEMRQEGHAQGYGYYQHGNTDPSKSHTQSLRSELPPSAPRRSELSGQAPVELGT